MRSAIGRRRSCSHHMGEVGVLRSAAWPFCFSPCCLPSFQAISCWCSRSVRRSPVSCFSVPILIPRWSAAPMLDPSRRARCKHPPHVPRRFAFLPSLLAHRVRIWPVWRFTRAEWLFVPRLGGLPRHGLVAEPRMRPSPTRRVRRRSSRYSSSATAYLRLVAKRSRIMATVTIYSVSIMCIAASHIAS
jgi:hypothetical protein